MKKKDSITIQKSETSRKKLIKNIIVMQFKFGLDALRDIVISPISIFAGIIDVIFSERKTGGLFKKVIYVGSLTDKWINLFHEHDPKPIDSNDKTQTIQPSLDDQINVLNKLITKKIKDKQVPQKTKEVLEKSLKKIKTKMKSKKTKQ